MKTQSVIRKLLKHGVTFRQSDLNPSHYVGTTPTMLVRFIDQGGRALCLSTCRIGDKSDMYNDYNPASYHSTIAACIDSLDTFTRIGDITTPIVSDLVKENT